MKKLLSLLMAAMLLPLSMGALTLEPNQKIMGHFTTDDIGRGWGLSLLRGQRPIATDITPDELAIFQGSKIVAFRVGLALSTPVSRVFVIPVAPNGQLGEETEWSCNVSEVGWNLIQLETPYEVNLPDDYSLRIGFEYYQDGSKKHVATANVGTIYTTMCYYNDMWKDYGTNVYGNLCVQCIAQNDNFPRYILRARNLMCKGNLKVGDDITFSFETCNLGADQLAPGTITYDISIDGAVVKTISNPVVVGSEYITISDAINSTGLTEGLHTFTVTVATLNGEPLDKPISLTSQFRCFTNGFSRQMRLVEQFTSTGCSWCPQGTGHLQDLCNMRDDIAWVAVHENMNNQDPFRTAQTDSITDLQGIGAFPMASFDRYVGLETPNAVGAVISTLAAEKMSNFLETVSELPSWATVNVNSTFDATTRQAVITINGDLVPNYEDFMGNDSKLTVYITEDGLVAPQVSGGNDYVHNNVLRTALVSVKGVALKKSGDSYQNVFTVNIPTAWKEENLSVVAFISRPLGNAMTDIFVTNANKRKLGEFDEPSIIPGDVDGDGKINIDDVTVLIDILLNGSASTAGEGADVDGDGRVNIDDVTVLIDKLLSGN